MIKRLFSLALITSFFLNTLGPLPLAQADPVVILPMPGTMVNPSPAFVPSHLVGLEIDPKNPFHIDFLINNEQNQNQPSGDTQEYLKMVKYFMGSLTVPTQEQWVNLSPYESSRIITKELGTTEMGRDLLGQDYILKQLTASLIYPEKEIGKQFWSKVYSQISAKYGADAKIPVNTFNKVWIMPESAVLYERGNQVWVVKSTMKVMLDTDYLALMKSQGSTIWGKGPTDAGSGLSKESADMIRNIIIPVIKKEVNEGKNFAVLRQVYNAMVLATWYKRALKESILTKVYGDARKIKGIDLVNPGVIDHIYQQYLSAYKKGVFNYIKEDVNPVTQESIPRKYFSGGFDPTPLAEVVQSGGEAFVREHSTPEDRAQLGRSHIVVVSVALTTLAASLLMSSDAHARGGYRDINASTPSLVAT